MTSKGLAETGLIEAIHAGNLGKVQNALSCGVDLELPDMHGYGGLPLRTACFEGHLAIVQELLNQGANPNAAASDGPGAPLRLALRMGHQDVADILVQSGAILAEYIAVTPELPAITYEPSLPGEAIERPPTDIKLDNMIEFTPSSMTQSNEEIDVPRPLGTETTLLSMDLLFLEERDQPTFPPKTSDER